MTFPFTHAARPLNDVDFDKEKTVMEKHLDAFQQNGSGWQVVAVEQLEWIQSRYQPIPNRKGHHRDFTLPASLKSKMALINVSDAPANECFR